MFGQSQWIRFSISVKDIPCEDVPKQLTLSSVFAGKDSVLLKEQFSVCQKYLEIPKIPGVYTVQIKTQLYELILVDFKIEANTPDSISLGEFKLKEPIAQLDEVTITGVQRKFIEIEADKTTLIVKDNPVLSISSIYDAILKVPGVMPYPGGGFAIGGQLATVYFEGVPSSLSTDDLMNLLKSLPANSVETIEIISNPGASFDANVSGAVININSIGKATKWLSGTVTLSYGLNQNQKISPSLVLNGRQSRWSWQLQMGYSNNERSNRDTSERVFNSFNPQIGLNSDRKEQTRNSYYYFKPSVTLNLSKRSSLMLNYNGSFGDNKINGNSVTASQSISPAVELRTDYKSRNYGMGNEGIAKFRQEFDTLKRVLNVTAFYSNYQNKSKRSNTQRISATDDYSILDYYMNINRFYLRADAEIPFEKIKFYLNTGVKYSLMDVKNIGSYNLNNSSSDIFDNPFYTSVIDFDYVEDNLAAYVDLKKKLGKKVSIGAGLRAENFSLRRASNVTSTARNNYFNFFPSFNAIYRMNSMVNIIGTYSRKIGIPNFTQYDPNNSGYYDSFSSSSGNTQLKPNFYDNAQFKITVLDYAQFSVNFTHSQFLNLNEVVVAPNSVQTVQTYRTYNNVNSMNYFLAIPVPFALFTKGLKFMDDPVDVDKMSFLYIYTSYTKTSISGYNYVNPNKGMWTLGVYSQFILPWKIRMNIDYYITSKGNYQIYEFVRNRSAFDVILSREFYDKKWKTSISFEDIFNTDQSNARVSFPNIQMNSYSKQDTRIIWFKVSYSFGKVEKNDSDGLNLPNVGGE
ncbi:outer membrane beta-barrel family protein [Fluviicola taffensis]|uniref:outer membrane beta-barrel family protein n=1 Tax=Fluviicola taffensis TaxID=191579 RepID=UPI0002E32E56|nr:outer membrane beta-barrel family protein [Fluviicola taffensis]